MSMDICPSSGYKGDLVYPAPVARTCIPAMDAALITLFTSHIVVGFT
jgi:hypothetical protein